MMSGKEDCRQDEPAAFFTSMGRLISYDHLDCDSTVSLLQRKIEADKNIQ
jgi:hypothetical protein